MARMMTEKGHTVSILTPEGNSGLHHETYLENITIHTYEVWEPSNTQEWPVPKPGFSAKVEKISQEHDILHSWTHFYLSALLLAWKKPHNHIVTLDTVPGESFSTGWLIDKAFYVFNRTLGKWILNRATKVTIYSDELRKSLERIGYSKEPAVTPTGVIVPEKTNQPELPEEYIAFIGLITERKGIDRVLDIARRMPDTTFLIAGDSPERKKWENKAPENATFLGKIDYVPSLLDEARCLLLPSRGEGLPGVVMEAMAMRCPVVASDISCIPDLIPDDAYGFLVKQDDISAYVEAIHTLKSRSIQEDLAEAAYKRITTNFSWEKSVETFLCVYRGVL